MKTKRRNFKNSYLILIAFSWFTILGCGNSSSFTNSGSHSPTNGSSQNNSASASCQAGVSTITNVRTLTKVVDQNSSRRVITYELNLIDCPGVTPVAIADLIYFDIDAGTTMISALDFVATSASQSVRGQLIPISGQDMFGREQANAFHYRADQKLQIPATRGKVLVEINLGNATWNTFPGSANNSNQDLSLPTYFKFGSAEPVRIDVLFTRKLY